MSLSFEIVLIDIHLFMIFSGLPKTRGAQAGEKMDTFGWLETKETTVTSHATLYLLSEF